MSSRQYIKHTVSTSQPPSGQIGDEWFNPATNTLSKLVVTNGTTVNWTSSVFASASASSGPSGATITNDAITNSNFYPTLANVNVGAFTAATVSSTKLYFNPSTGTLNSTVFNSLSDETVKTNKERIINALAKLMTLGGYTYLLVDSEEPSAGLLAQEVQKVLPEAVKYNPDTGLLSLNYNAVLGMVVEAINELETRVSGLEDGR